MKRILLVDGSNLLHRGYHAITSRYSKDAVVTYNESTGEENPPTLDIPVSVFVTSFLQSLKNYVTEFQAEETYVAWDKKLIHPSTNFRKQAKTVAYKANRDPEMSKKVFASEETLTPILRSLGVKVIFPRVMEADDVIAWLSYQLKDHKLTIISVDKDLTQLVTSNCTWYNPIKQVKITPDNFEKLLSVPQDKYLRYKAIVGDVSDNIDGLMGYGPVKGKKLTLAWDSTPLDPELRTIVESNIKLIDLAHGYTVHPEEVISYQEQFDQLQTHSPDFKAFGLLVEEHKLNQIKYQLEKWRGTFNRGGKVGGAPLNSILKNLFT